MGEDRPEVGAGVADVDLTGTTALVTGGTDGIGRETALALGRLGASVVVHGRDREKGRRVVERLRESGADADLHLADFATQDAVRDLAAAIRETNDRVDVLVNNAGAVFQSGGLTDDGIERTMAVNHVAPFLLTNLLWPALSAASAPRVVVVASAAHRGSEIDFDGFRTPGSGGFTAYGRSKLANLLFVRELARRFETLEVAATANALHPGAVPGSNVYRTYPALVRAPIRASASVPVLSDLLFSSVVEGAETPVYLAAAPDLDANGEYFVDCRPRRPYRRARDDATARRLWRVSEELTGLDDSGEPRVPGPGD